MVAKRYAIPSFAWRDCTENMKDLAQDNLPPGRDLKLCSPKYEAGLLTTQQRHSVSSFP
jgi:hypothetical protein